MDIYTPEENGADERLRDGWQRVDFRRRGCVEGGRGWKRRRGVGNPEEEATTRQVARWLATNVPDLLHLPTGVVDDVVCPGNDVPPVPFRNKPSVVTVPRLERMVREFWR